MTNLQQELHSKPLRTNKLPNSHIPGVTIIQMIKQSFRKQNFWTKF